MYRHIRNARWAISFFHTDERSWTDRLIQLEFLTFFSSLVLPFFRSLPKTSRERERYRGNYWRIIECWHIVLISCRSECAWFMQHCSSRISTCDMNDCMHEPRSSANGNRHHPWYNATRVCLANERCLTLSTTDVSRQKMISSYRHSSSSSLSSNSSSRIISITIKKRVFTAARQTYSLYLTNVMRYTWKMIRLTFR